jgi:hypothetical protein
MWRQDSLLLQELERQIHVRTGRQVRNLAVKLGGEHVTLDGQAATYYVKQLAQHAVLDLLPDIRIENAIAVEKA